MMRCVDVSLAVVAAVVKQEFALSAEKGIYLHPGRVSRTTQTRKRSSLCWMEGSDRQLKRRRVDVKKDKGKGKSEAHALGPTGLLLKSAQEQLQRVSVSPCRCLCASLSRARSSSLFQIEDEAHDTSKVPPVPLEYIEIGPFEIGTWYQSPFPTVGEKEREQKRGCVCENCS